MGVDFPIHEQAQLRIEDGRLTSLASIDHLGDDFPRALVGHFIAQEFFDGQYKPDSNGMHYRAGEMGIVEILDGKNNVVNAMTSYDFIGGIAVVMSSEDETISTDPKLIMATAVSLSYMLGLSKAMTTEASAVLKHRGPSFKRGRSRQ